MVHGFALLSSIILEDQLLKLLVLADSFIPSREASLLNNPRKFNQTLTGSVHRLVTISLEMRKGGGSSDQELGEVSQKVVNIGNRQLVMESMEVTEISKVGDAVSDFEQKIREIDRELTEDGGGSNLNILKSDAINLQVPLEVNCDANSEIVGDKEVVDKMDKLHAIHVSNPMNCGPMENPGKSDGCVSVDKGRKYRGFKGKASVKSKVFKFG